MPVEKRTREDTADSRSIRVLIADDEPVLREAIADLIGSLAGLELAGAGSDTDEAIALARDIQPDVALVDVKMPGGGEEAVHGIMRCSPATRVIVLSAYDDAPTVIKMLSAGAVGYLVKGVSSDEIVEAMRRAARGQSSLSTAMTNGVLEELARSQGELRAVELALRISEKNLRALRAAEPSATNGVDSPSATTQVNAQTEAVDSIPSPGLLVRTNAGKPRVRQPHLVDAEDSPAEVGARPARLSPDIAGPRAGGAGIPTDTAARESHVRAAGAASGIQPHRLANARFRKVGGEGAAIRDRSKDRGDASRRLAGPDHSLGAIANEERSLLAAYVRDMGEIGERRLQIQTGQDAARRRDLLARLIASGEDERRRIAADIHDDSIQAITAAGMRLQMLRATLDQPHQLDLIGEIESTIRMSISRLRHLLFELLPPHLGTDDLTAALKAALHEAGRDITTCFQLEDELASQPSAETGLILYRITQEALANVRRHARAANTTIRLDEIDGGYRVRVCDDGVGFVSDTGHARSAPGHLGLTAMHERAELAGGWLRIDGDPGKGTVLECWIPNAAQALS